MPKPVWPHPSEMEGEKLTAWRCWVGHISWPRDVYRKRYELAITGSKSYADDLDAFVQDFIKQKLKGKIRWDRGGQSRIK